MSSEVWPDPWFDPVVGAPTGWLRHPLQPAIHVASRMVSSVCPVLGGNSRQVQRIDRAGVQADALWLGFCLVVAEVERDVDLAGAQQLQCLGWLGTGQVDLETGIARRSALPRPAGRVRPITPEESWPRAPGHGQLDVCGELDVAASIRPMISAPQSARKSCPAGVARTPRPARCSSSTGLLEPGEVVADRRLRVVELLRRRGCANQSREGIKDARPSDVQHVSSISYGPVSRLALDGRMSRRHAAPRHDRDADPPHRPLGHSSPASAPTRRQAHGDWAETAQHVTDQLRRHLPAPDVLTRRAAGSAAPTTPATPCTSDPTARLDRRPRLATGAITRSTTTSPGASSASSRASSTRSCSTPTGTWSAATRSQVGDVGGFRPARRRPPRARHRRETAISIHVYGTDVTHVGSRRRYYD